MASTASIAQHLHLVRAARSAGEAFAYHASDERGGETNRLTLAVPIRLLAAAATLLAITVYLAA